jgi:hypothetical protein
VKEKRATLLVGNRIAYPSVLNRFPTQGALLSPAIPGVHDIGGDRRQPAIGHALPGDRAQILVPVGHGSGLTVISL